MKNPILHQESPEVALLTDWQRIQTLFLEAVDLPPLERSRHLEQQCFGDPHLLADVISLLAADNADGAEIEAVVQQEAANLFDAQTRIGERLGLYRIVREIGRGGMGSVYLATRDDAEYNKEVALKIVRRGMDTADVLERFRYERQILANLEHPYIARLFDGGSTADGVPFFVMEYIEGKPVNEFCREQALDFDAICALFLRILEAVAYAHRNLVVHRDLKPGNILITADGLPKLLDFGVARLLNGDPGDNRTSTHTLRPFTAGYASPEQVSGLPLTTLTDIYSLGVILYELLAAKPAQPIKAHTPSEIERVVCNTVPLRPGLLTRGLSFDLDNIVMMALRKDPERRYQSIGQFADDISRYLQGRPVIARQDSLRYRFGKFIRRNSLQVSAAGLVALSLIVGLFVSLGQTHRADLARHTADSQRAIALNQTALAEAARNEATRQTFFADQQRASADEQRTVAAAQRDQAQQQKALAERRTKDILELADRTLFTVHDSIARLPGSIPARRTLVQTTLQYLEVLEHEAGLNDDMREALCAAYYKVAMIQGDAHGASLQDFHGAETDLLKAQALILPAYNRNPHDPKLIQRLIDVRSGLADLMLRTGRHDQAIAIFTDLLPVAHGLALVPNCPLDCKTQEPVMENFLTFALLSSDPPKALVHANRGIALTQALLLQHPSDPTLQQTLASLTASGAGAYRGLGELEKASVYYLECIRAREALLHNDPNDDLIRRDLMIVYGNYAIMLGLPWSANLNRPDDARLYAAKGVAIARQMVAADANNATARHDLGMILSRLGMIDPAPGGGADSLKILEEARSLIEPIALANPGSAETARQLAMVLQYEGRRQGELGQSSQAIETYRKAMALMNRYSTQDAASILQLTAVEEDLARLYIALGDTPHALETATHSLAELKQADLTWIHSDSHVSALADGWSVLALAQSLANQPAEARQSAANAVQLWKQIKTPARLPSYRGQISQMQSLLAPPHLP